MFLYVFDDAVVEVWPWKSLRHKPLRCLASAFSGVSLAWIDTVFQKARVVEAATDYFTSINFAADMPGSRRIASDEIVSAVLDKPRLTWTSFRSNGGLFTMRTAASRYQYFLEHDPVGQKEPTEDNWVGDAKLLAVDLLQKLLGSRFENAWL